MNFYSLGFAFDPKFNRVVLIQKNRPAWQAGKLNGIGGHIEPPETPAEAMAREFNEETSVWIAPEDWHLFCDMEERREAIIHCYWTTTDRLQHVRTVTDERVVVASVGMMVNARLSAISNIPWLLAMAIDSATHETFRLHTRVLYRPRTKKKDLAPPTPVE